MGLVSTQTNPANSHNHHLVPLRNQEPLSCDSSMAQLTCRIVDIMTGRRIVLLNSDDCERVDICVHDRARLKQEDNDVVATVDTKTTLVDRGEIGITNDIIPELDVRDGDAIEVTLMPSPNSTEFIRKKIFDGHLSKDDIQSVVGDAVNGLLTDVEMAGFLIAQQFHGMSDDEQVWLTKAIGETGERIDFEKPVHDKHSVGDVPRNKVSLLIVPIVAQLG